MVKSETTTMEKRVKSQALEKFVHNKRAVFGVIVVLVIALCCLLLPLVMDLDPYTTDELAGFNSAPSAEHILGTDDVGRDLFARLLYGGRISLFVGIASTIISVLIGVPLGLLAGYYRGIWETIIMRAADIFMSFPSMILILVLVAVFGPSIMNVTIVIGVLGWTSMAKLIYGNTLSMGNLSSQVQQQIGKDFRGGVPVEAFARTMIQLFCKLGQSLCRKRNLIGVFGNVLPQQTVDLLV